jgi:hypothetical protein
MALSEFAGREPAQPGLFGGADPVLDPGVGAMPGLQERELSDLGVGGQALVAPAVVGFEHADLRARVRPFPPDQHPHSVRPARVGETGQQPGQLGDLSHRQPRLIDRARFTGGVDRDRPCCLRQQTDRVLELVGEAEPDRERHVQAVLMRPCNRLI